MKHNSPCDACSEKNQSCKRCSICYHSATCTCDDYTIFQNICSHLHFAARNFPSIIEKPINDEIPDIDDAPLNEMQDCIDPNSMLIPDVEVISNSELPNVQSNTSDSIAAPSLNEKKMLKSKILSYVNRILQEDDIDLLKKNLKIFEKMEFSDKFHLKDFSKNTKFDKQLDFAPKKRKYTKFVPQNMNLTCLNLPSTCSDERKALNEGIINRYLDMLSNNFSFNEFNVGHTEILQVQEAIEQCQPTSLGNFKDMNFAPFYLENEWSVIISMGDKLTLWSKSAKMPNIERRPLSYDHQWQSGYSILIKCTQELTKCTDEHTGRLINRFRRFLSESFKDDENVYEFCQRCFSVPKDEKICPSCSLKFCRICLNNSICNRCL